MNTALGLPPAPEQVETSLNVQSAIERTVAGDLVVTSLTIADGAEVQHKNVLELIDTHQRPLERFGQVAFETRKGKALPQGGFAKATRIALLNEQQSTLIMTFMRNTEKVIDFKVALVDAFFELGRKQSQGFDPAKLTKIQVLQMALESEERAERAEAKILADAPKIEYMETFVANADAMSFRTVASTLRIQETKLRDLLIACSWIYREDTERYSNSEAKVIPQYRYSEYSTKKPYFLRQQEHNVPRFRGEVMHTLKITAPGGNAISRLLHKAVAQYGDLDTAIQVLEANRQAQIAERKARNTDQDGLF